MDNIVHDHSRSLDVLEAFAQSSSHQLHCLVFSRFVSSLHDLAGPFIRLSDRILDPHRDYDLLLAFGEHAGEGRSASHTLYAGFRYDVPGASVRIHLCPECEYRGYLV